MSGYKRLSCALCIRACTPTLLGNSSLAQSSFPCIQLAQLFLIPECFPFFWLAMHPISKDSHYFLNFNWSRAAEQVWLSFPSVTLALLLFYFPHHSCQWNTCSCLLTGFEDFQLWTRMMEIMRQGIYYKTSAFGVILEKSVAIFLLFSCHC